MAADLHPPGSVTPQRLRGLALFGDRDERPPRPVAVATGVLGPHESLVILEDARKDIEEATRSLQGR